MSQWYFARGGQQNGPVSFSELKTLAASGQLDAQRDLVWCDGMTDWKPAGQIADLFTAASAATSITPTDAANPYAPPTISGSPVAALNITFPFVKRANYPLMAGLIIGGIVLLAAAFSPAVLSELAGRKPSKSEFAIMGLVGGIGGILVVIGGIQSLIYLYRAWLVLHPRTSISTPGKAVGFMFIPLFNFYWKFIAYWKWAQEWNRLVADQPDHAGAPRQSEGLFLAYAILGVAGIFAGALAAIPSFVIYMITMNGMCKAINYAADNSERH